MDYWIEARMDRSGVVFDDRARVAIILSPMSNLPLRTQESYVSSCSLV